MSQGDEPKQAARDAAGWVEATGRTVAEATGMALELLGLQVLEDIEVEVLEEPQRGLLGLGAREARVRARSRVAKGKGLLELVEDVARILGLHGAQVAVSDADESYVKVNVTGPNLGVLIGRRGETLDAFQYLFNLAAARIPGESKRVIFDAGGYRDRRRLTLERLAGRVAENVRRTSREMVLEPMTPQERKVIHMFLAGVEGVRSESTGEEPFRRIVVYPAGTKPAGGSETGPEGSGEPADDDE